MAGDPTIAELIDDMISSRLLDLHTMLPAKVVSYDRATHTVEARIMVNRTVGKADGSQLIEEVPPIPNVPVAWPEGGAGPAGNAYYLEFPLVAGNEGILVFSESAWGHFRENQGQLSEPGDLRRHALGHCSFVPCRISNGGEYESAGQIGLLIVPDERAFSVRRRGETDDFVALAGKTNARLDAIEEFLAGLTLPVSGSTAGPPTPGTTPVGASVACESLKAGPA